VIGGCRAAHGLLLATIAGLDDASARSPSLLPGWTVAHLLTHLARNADSHVRQLEAARRREPTERYPGGRGQRAGEIDAGADCPAAQLVADVAETIAKLERTWESLEEGTWGYGGGTSMGAAEPAALLPWKRWREVEVHHADLGMGFGFDDWSVGYVRRELHLAEMGYRASQPMGLTGLPAAALRLPPARRLGWLTGRLTVPDLPAPPPWP
jgi:maleylpyruvate isomerase